MDTAGFVLAGGRSARMGRDKALLDVAGMTLLERVAGEVRKAVGSVTVVAPAGRYERFGFSILPDGEPGLGPLGGICTALASTQAQWNLMVACDMPELTAAFLTGLLERARSSGAEAFVPLSGPGRPEPLCAVYAAACAVPFGRALAQGTRKVREVLLQVRTEYWQVSQSHFFTNINRPQDRDSILHV